MGSFIDPEWLLHYIAEGSWEFRMRERVYVVQAGDLVLLPPRLLHLVRPTGECRLVHWVCHFELVAGPEYFEEYPLVIRPEEAARGRAEVLFRLLMEGHEDSRRRGTPELDGLVSALLGLYVSNENCTYMSKYTDGNWGAVERAVMAIQIGFQDENLDLRKISQSAGLSVTHFCRLFKTRTGYGAMQYLNQHRVWKAEELLLRTAMNCTQIAEAVGLSGVHHFSRLFRKLRGESPMAYRRRYRG